MPKFSTPRGTADVLPEDWAYWDFVLSQASDVARLFGYRRIQTPILGDTALFTRATGDGTDIVDKEMYSFRDRGGDELSLRPEGTAPVMRAYFQHGMDRLPQPVKLFYFERMYRFDRPQHLRYREHTQFGCEAIGIEDAFVDVEMISLLDTFYRRIGLTDLALYLNSIGDQTCRPRYLEDLVRYLRLNDTHLAELDRERVIRNPLRVLDSKEALSQSVIEGAPHMLDYLCDACQAHWAKLLRGLNLLGIPVQINHRLVRGLDYYTRTVFEFAPPSHGAQSVVGGGGRYDALAEAMGAKHVPGIGFGAGIERLVWNVRERDVTAPAVPSVLAYVTHAGEGTEDAAILTTDRLRRDGIPTDMAFGERSLKAQLRHANAAGARYALIVGEDEVTDGTMSLRDLAVGEQTRVPADNIASILEAGAH